MFLFDNIWLVYIMLHSVWVPWGGADANIWSASAPKIERASFFLHVSSGILKIASLEVEES